MLIRKVSHEYENLPRVIKEERNEMKSIIYTSLLVLFSAAAFGQSQDTTVQRQNQQKKQKMDRFIDADGDGICDHRAKGLGFERGKRGEGKMKGKQQTEASGTSTGTGKQYRGGRK
jgi:hypothetical protein